MKATVDSTEVAEDNTALEELDDDSSDEGEAENSDEEDKEEEIDPSVAASDAAVIDEVVAELEQDFDLPRLTHAEVNLGKFTVMKVMFLSWTLDNEFRSWHIVSYEIFPSKYSAVPHCVLTLRPPASGVKLNPF